MSGSELRELLDDGALLFALTVDQYHQMIKQGIVAEGEPYELLHGCLVRKDRSASGEDAARVGTHHAWAVITLERIGRCRNRAVMGIPKR